MGNIIIDIPKLLRVKQYVKNLLIFAPVFFAANLFDANIILKLTIIFFGFSLVTSFIYILNDINDIDFDKKHEAKCKRPIASGTISVKSAYIIAATCLVVGGLFIYNSIYIYIYIYI